MTESLAKVLQRRAPTARRSATPDRVALTFSDDLRAALAASAVNDSRVEFPNPMYQADPVGFFRNVLGVTPWDRQCEILNAVRDHSRVAVSSGHKIGKSTSAAGIALWFFASWPDARAIMSSTTARQVDQILWREVRMLRARSGRCVDCKAKDPYGHLIPVPCPHSAIIDGDQGELARTGLKSRVDFREIVGFTAREAEAVAGISGRNLIYILDEASGIPDLIFEAIEGNRAGGAKIVMFGNPTQNQGEFYDAFHSKSRHYFTLRVSSEETPNAISGENLVPGLATKEWIAEKEDEWGRDSALFIVRVLGRHADREEGKVFSLHDIELSEQRWESTAAAGRLYIGVDPAGASGTGDDAAFVARRGLRQVDMQAKLGLTEEAHLTHVLLMIKAHGLPRETPVVVLDREGPIGAQVYRVMMDYLAEPAHRDEFELVSVRASSGAIREPQLYDRMRDELAANLYQWMRDGGAILEDIKLEADLHVFDWRQMVNGKMKITPKDIVRKLIGRSPDRYDALALSCWEPLSLRDDNGRGPRGVSAEQQSPLEQYVATEGGVMDPYAAMDVWRK